MALFLNTNMAASTGRYNLQQISDQINLSVQKLSTGSRVNASRDDAAGLRLADQMTTQLTGLTQSNRNANYGLALAQIAEGSLTEVSTNLQRGYQLAVTSGNRTLSSEGRIALGEEFKVLMETNNRIANNTKYGDIQILNYESDSAGFKIQTRPEPAAAETVTTGNAILGALFGKLANTESITGQTLSTISANLGNTGTLGKLIAAYMVVTGESDAGVGADALLTGTRAGDISLMLDNSAIEVDIAELKKVLVNEVTAQVGQSALITGVAAAFTAFADTAVDSATGFSDSQINQLHAFTTDALLTAMTGLSSEVTRQRTRLGAEQNGLSSTIRANSTAMVNIKEARGRITDTDYAAETASLTRNRILFDTVSSVLAQANQRPGLAMALLR